MNLCDHCVWVNNESRRCSRYDEECHWIADVVYSIPTIIPAEVENG